MNFLSKYFRLIFILFLYKLKCQEEIELFKTLKFSYPNNNTEKILLSKMKFYKGKIFYNFPRIRNKTKMFDSTSDTFLSFQEGNSTPWPNKETNTINNSKIDCSKFISIIDFNFDDNDNIYLLDEGDGNNCLMALYQYNINDKKLIQKIEFSEKITLNFTINDFVIDTINNFTYIAYSNRSDKLYEIGIIAKNLNDNSNSTIKKVFNENKYKTDEKYQYSKHSKIPLDNKNKINIALSCDGKYLMFSPQGSRMIYSMLTDSIRENKDTYINEAYKNDSASAMILSSLGNLYFAGNEYKKIYIEGQIDNDLSIFDYKGFKTRENNTMNYVNSLSIDNGFLYINSIKNQTKKGVVFLDIFKTRINNEKSYFYGCSGLGYVWTLNTYIIWLLFLIILCVISVFVYYGNQQDKEVKYNKNQ